MSAMARGGSAPTAIFLGIGEINMVTHGIIALSAKINRNIVSGARRSREQLIHRNIARLSSAGA